MSSLDKLNAKLDKILNPSTPDYVESPKVKPPTIDPAFYQIAAGLGNDAGAGTMSPVEKDLRTLTPNQLIAKYGQDQATAMLDQLAVANNDLYSKRNSERDWGQTIPDNLLGFGNALLGGLGSVAAYGVGKVDAEAGLGISSLVSDLNKFTHENQSAPLNARREVGALKDSLTGRDNAAIRQRNIDNGDSELVAGLKNIGQEFITSSVLDDPMLLQQGTADVLGSVASAMVTAGVIRGAAGLLVPRTTANAIKLSGAMDAALGEWTATRLASHAPKLVWPLTVGATESGSIYHQTAEDAAATLKAQGKSVGDNLELINDTAQEAADTMFLPAVGLGTISNVGNRARAGVTGVKNKAVQTITDLGREGFEETGQGLVGTVASNQAIANNIDPTRQWDKGGGEAAAHGLVYGSLAAGAMQSPGLAKELVLGSVDSTLGAIDKSLAAAEEKADNLSPVGTKALKEKASTLVPNAEPVKQTLAAELSGTDLTPEEKDQGIKYANDLVDSLKVNVENEFDDTIPPELSSIISGSEHRIDAIQQLAKKVITTSDPNEKLLTAATMYQLLQPILDLQTNRPSSVDNLSPESQAVLKDYESLIANVNNSPTIKNAMKQIHDIMVAQGATVISPVMEEELDTPAGKQKVQSIITAASIAPDQGNLDATESIMKHAKEGKLNLTPEQTTTLNASVALLRARKELEEKNKQFGLNAADIVSSEILTDRGVKDNNARSATQYTQEILSAVRRGNTLGATQLLYDMGLFVKHMRNKVEAINKHYLNGNPKAAPVPYEALLPHTHQWVDSATNPKALYKGGFVNTLNPDSIKFVQGVELEHKILADVYNSLTEVFPDLGIDRIEPLQLEKGISSASIVSNTGSNNTTPPTSNVPPTPASTPPVEAEIKTTPATWSNQDTDLPVDVFVDDNGTPISENGYTKVRYTAPDGKVTINYLPTTEITLDSDNDKRIKQLQDKASKASLEELERIFKAVQAKITNKDSTTRIKEISDVYGSEITKRVAEMKEKDFMIKYTALRGSVAKGNTEDSPLLAIYNKHFQKNLKEGTAAKTPDQSQVLTELNLSAKQIQDVTSDLKNLVSFETVNTNTNRQTAQLGSDYTYSGKTYEGQPIPTHIQVWMDAVNKALGTAYNSVLVQYYPANTKSGIGFHKDNEKDQFDTNQPVISLSIGQTIPFIVHEKLNTPVTFNLKSGDVFKFDGNKLHGIATQNHTGERYSLTLRQFHTVKVHKTTPTPKQTTSVQSVVPPYYTGKITPDKNTVFVFGSNPEGIHGAGAALVAKNQFGAKYGQGEGLQGNAYALPTKDLRVTKDKGLRSIPGTQITESIKKLYVVAKQHPDKLFKIAFTNTTEASLNGYTGLEMIEMFNAAGVAPANIIFSEEWFKTGKLLSTKVTPKQTAPVVETKAAPKIGDTSTVVKGRFTITKTVVSDNTVLSVHTNNEDGKVTKSEYVTTYPDIYSDELGDKYTVVIYRDSANPSVITDVESFDPKDKKNSIGSYGKQGNQTDEKFITTFTEESDVTLEYTNKFEKPLAKITPIVETKSEPVIFKGKMTFAYGSNKRSDVESNTTFDAIKAGERTATTRYESDGKIDYWSKAKVGDIIEFSNKDGDIVRVEVTKPLTKLPSNTDGETWSKKEGWSIDYFNKNVKPKLGKAYQLEYKLIGKAEPKTTPPVSPEAVEEITHNPEMDSEINKGTKNYSPIKIRFKKEYGIVYAKPVSIPGYESIKFSIYKDSKGHYKIVETSTGILMPSFTGLRKIKDVIDSVKSELDKHSLSKIESLLDKEPTLNKGFDYVSTKQSKSIKQETKVITVEETKAEPILEEIKPPKAFELNEGQKNAFTRIMEFINDGRQTFSLVGPAGTGKTTIVNTIVAALKKAGSIYGEVILTSPTHRANTVTRSKNPDETVVTLHKLLGLSPSIDLDNLTAEDVKFAQRQIPEDKDPFPKKGLVIVDESSMMNKELYNFLMIKLAQYPKVKILFLGDLAQLRPIVKDTKDANGNTVKAISTDSPALLDTKNQAVLDEVMRAKNPELLDESVYVRNGVRFSNTNNMTESNGVSFSNSFNEFTDALVTMFKSKDFLNNRLLVRAVAYTNDRVKEINKKVRAALFGSKAADYIPGDLIMGYKTYLDKEDSKKILVANGVDYLVLDVSEVRTEVQKGTNKYGMNLPDVSLLVQDLTVKDIYGVDGVTTVTVVLPSNTEETWAALGQIYNELSKLPRKNPHMKEEVATYYTNAVNRFVLPQDVTIPSVDWNGKPYLDKDGKPKTKSVAKRSIDYGYAHTIHKSQGGTYTYVFVDDTTIFGNDAKRLRYVGMTRAEKGAYILTNGRIKGDEPTHADFIESDERITEAELESQYEEEVPVEIPDIDTVTSWARYPTAGVPNIEVSTKGDAFGKQFSALNATLNDGRTIEEAYQVGIKGHASIAAGKGKPPLNNLTKEETWQAYKNLWRDFFDENPELYEELKEKARGKVLTDQFASTFVSQARAISEILNEHYILNIPKNPKKTETPTVEPTNKVDPKTFTNHSGGANGADTFWDIVGRPLGFTNHNHYKESGGTVSSVLAKAKVSITKLDEDQMAFAKKAIDKLFGKGFLERWSKKSEKDLQIRNYYQVANADAVFAIATLDLKNNRVNGGTNTAVQLGIKLGKPVYVWDTTTEQWFKLRGNKFVKTDTPVLTKNFAGVGTRKIANYSVPNERDSAGRIISWTTTKEKGEYLGEAKEAAAKQAIRDVYAKTLSGATTTNEELDNELPVEDNIIDDSPIVTGNKNAVIKVKPDVVAPSKLKKLVQGIQNFFIQSFKFKGKETTRTDDVESPLQFVRQTLIDLPLFRETVPNSKYDLNRDVARAYREYLGTYYDNLSNTLTKNLQDFLTVPNKKGVVRLNRINKGDPLHRYGEGKVLNLTEKVGDTYKYNQHLLELATLAGLQWFLTAGQTERRLEPREIAKLTGIPEGKLSDLLIDSILNTSDTGQLSQSLTNTIKSFWGVSGINTEMMAYTDGIAEAMAAEILRAFEELGMINKTYIYIDKATNQQLIPDPNYYLKLQELENDEETKKKIKTVIRFEVNRFDNDALYSFPTAIQEVVLIESEDVTYFGDDIPPVPQTQLGDETIKLSRKEKKAVANANKTGVKTNTLQANILMSATEQSIIIAFGGGIENEHMNINTLASIQGKNKTTLNAYRAMVDMLSKVNNVAEKSGIDPSDVVMRFPHTITSVGRAMMLGKYNIQSSKLLREVFLPTWSTLDLQNNQNHYVAFQLGVAQALGIKVHDEGPNSITLVQELLANQLSSAVSLVQDWMEATDNGNAKELVEFNLIELARIFKVAQKGLTPNAFHALVEYVRYQRTEDKTKFTTGLYLEADGVTNGPGNAIEMLTLGQFTAEWVTTVEKIGHSFAEPKAKHELDKNNPDLYKTGGINSVKHSQEIITKMKQSPDKEEIMQILGSLYSLLSMNVKGITYDPSKLEETGGVLANRDFFKNPLTILVYGSGIPGLASKAARQMADNIYKRFSDANILLNSKEGKNLTIAQAMFPGDENAEQTYKKFVEDLNRIRSTTINTEYIDRKKVYVVEGVTQPKREYIKSELQKFTFSDSEIDAITQNITKGLVEAMYEGAVETVGRTVMQSSKMIQQATQIQSILLQAAFTKAIQDKIANRVATSKDTGYMKSDFISKQDFMDIMEELKVIAPYLKTPDQTFLAAKSGRYRNEKDEAIGYSLSLNSKYRTDPNIYIPTNAGVSGTPNLVIGLGDAYAILQAASDESMIGNLWIFDGINMPLDKILDYAPKLNKAAFEAWQNNPLRVVEESFRSFMGEKSMMIKALNETLNNEDLADQLNKSLRLYKTQDKLSSGDSDYALSIFGDLLNDLKNSADSIDARHAAIARMPNSVDQLAAAGVPYHNDVTVDPTLDTPEKIAEQLNKYYQEELDKIKNKPKAEPVKKMTPEEMDPITKDMLSNTVTDKFSGVKILHAAGLLNLGKSINLSREQRKAYIQLVRSNKLDGYKVVFGSIEQIKKYRELQGYRNISLDQETDNGVIDMNNKVIHLINPSVETLVHEMIHAATYGSVLNYYRDSSLNSKEVNEAIERTEKLLDEFLKLSPKELARLTPEQRVAINNVKAAIEEPGNDSYITFDVALAKSLNEFMAWSLSNQELISAFKNVKLQLPTALQIAKEVIAIIKKFFTFKDKTTGEIKEEDLTVPEDLFGNLLFNASIIINDTNPSIATTMAETTLFHSANGGVDHITQLRGTLMDKVVLFLNNTGQPINISLYNSGFGKTLTEAKDTVSSLVPIFGISGVEETTLNYVVAALSTEIQIDPLTIDGIQTLYSHAVVELAKQVDAGTYPKAKYDALIGRIGNPKIINGKSTLLPVFLGLGLIDTELRDALAKIDMPTKTKNTTGTLDAGLDNFFNKMLDGLFKALTGQRKANNVADALELLTERLTEIALKESRAINSPFNAPGNNADKANKWVSDNITKLGDKGLALGAKLETSNKLRVKQLGSAVTLLSSLASETNGETVSRAAISIVNKTNAWKPFREFITDLTNRTESNALVYDLIKKVRAAVQQLRQNYRTEVPKKIAKKFNRLPTNKEWSNMFRSMAKTDLASLIDIMTKEQMLDLFTNPNSLNKQIAVLENRIQNQDKTNWSLYQTKMKQLANYMNTGVTGSNFLRNPYAIHGLLNEAKPKNFKVMGKDAVHSIDQLTTLYAIEGLSQQDKTDMAEMIKEESEALGFIIDYLVGQSAGEVLKAANNPVIQLNYYKGHIPQINKSGSSLLVATDDQMHNLKLRGYTRIGDYAGSNLDPNRIDKGYYFSTVSANTAVSQGTIQNVQKTISGVDDTYGFTVGSMVDRITDPAEVRRITVRLNKETNTIENLMPVFNGTGEVIAYERSMNPEMVAMLKPSEHLAEMIGVWRGRQIEEQMATEINKEVIDNHYTMWKNDIAKSPSSQKEYVNILDPKQLDVIEQDMVSLFSFETRQYIANTYGSEFWVRKDVMNDMIGFRKASIADVFTGKTRLSKQTQEVIKKVLVTAFGYEAYKYAVNSEKFIQNVTNEVRTLIIVKSIIVPMFNIASNIVQLIARGVPIKTILKAPTKILELRSYTQSQVKQVGLEAELRAASGNPSQQKVLEAQIQAIKDGHKRLSIWPLIEAGEFSTISDIGSNSEDIDLFSGNSENWLRNKIDKLPPALKTTVRYGFMTRDTALFQGLQKMVQYGDFIAKAVMYDDLLIRKGLTKEQALGKITDEFVNYDKLPGRFRGYLEDMGVLWFWNYKLRITKVALSIMRENPINALMLSVMPIPIGSGTPMGDNFVTKLLDGSLTGSIGPGMSLQAAQLTPVYNILN